MDTINFILPIESLGDPEQYDLGGSGMINLGANYRVFLLDDGNVSIKLTKGDGVDSQFGGAKNGSGGNSSSYAEGTQAKIKFVSVDDSDNSNLYRGFLLVNYELTMQNKFGGGKILTNIAPHSEGIFYEKNSSGQKMYYKKYTADLE